MVSWVGWGTGFGTVVPIRLRLGYNGESQEEHELRAQSSGHGEEGVCSLIGLRTFASACIASVAKSFERLWLLDISRRMKSSRARVGELCIALDLEG